MCCECDFIDECFRFVVGCLWRINTSWTRNWVMCYIYTWHDSVRLLINIRTSSVMIIGNIWLLSLLNLSDVRGSPHKGQWRGAMIFSLICAWTNGWVNNRDSSDLRHQYAHNDVTVMNDFVHDYNAMPLELFERAHLIGRPIKSDIIFSVRMQNLFKQMYYFGL